MKHFLELTPTEFAAIDSPLLVKTKATYASGDELTITQEGHRDQITVGITRVLREKIHATHCYLVLNGLDDVANVLHKNDSQKDNSQ